MTIEYKDSKRIVALSTDTVETITLDEDFSSYADQTAFDNSWVSLDTAQNRGNPTNDNLDVVLKTDNSDDTMAHDLGSSLSDTAWVCRFKWDITGLTRNNVSAWHGWIGLSSTNQTGEFDDLQDSMGLTILTQNTGGNTMFWYASGSSAGAVNEQNSQFDDDVPTGTYYIEMIRNADVITVNVYTDSNYTTLFDGGSNTITGTVTGLRYFKVANKTASYSGTITSTIDDLKIWNGVTSISSRPTNVQDNSLLIENDTARRYWFDANPLLDDDFSTDDWTDSGANVGISSGVMNFDIDRTTTDQSSYYQLSRALSDTKWTMRLHDVIVTTKSGGVEVFIGVSSNTSGAQTAQDFIGLNLGDNTANPVLGGVDSDGAVIARLAGDYTYSLSTTYNIEIIRESATSYRIKVFSNSGFDSTALFSQSYTCTATTTGLQYVKFANGQVAGSTENIIGTCSKVEIFDGVTTASGGGQWTMQPTFEDDFSSDNFTQTGTEIDVSGGELVWDAQPDGTTTGGYIDFGENLSDTAWVCRFKVQVNNYSGAVTTATNFFIQLQSITTVDSTTSRDSMGIHLRLKSGNTDWRVEAVDGSLPGGGAGNLIDGSATTETIYVQMYRDGNTIYAEWYDNADYTGTPTNTANHSSGTPANLRYFAVYRRSDTTTTGVSNGIIDDLKIYNGVTSIN